VPENQTSAIDVETSDDNDSEGSGLTYSLSGGADQSLFSIDANSGVVTFTNAPDFEAPVDANGNNDYELQVTVTDSSGLTDTQDLV
ncbi:cadherin repeat domain-containing protein, partial [Adonisia turfae]